MSCIIWIFLLICMTSLLYCFSLNISRLFKTIISWNCRNALIEINRCIDKQEMYMHMYVCLFIFIDININDILLVVYIPSNNFIFLFYPFHYCIYFVTLRLYHCGLMILLCLAIVSLLMPIIFFIYALPLVHPNLLLYDDIITHL